jgi:hypothetical protein
MIDFHSLFSFLRPAHPHHARCFSHDIRVFFRICIIRIIRMMSIISWIPNAVSWISNVDDHVPNPVW